MKKLTNTILFIAASALALASCQKDVNETVLPEDDGTVVLTINAGSPETKTAISGSTPTWKAGDKVSVVYKKTGESSWSKKASEALAADGATAPRAGPRRAHT